MPLNLQPNIDRADDVYQALIDMHKGLSDEKSAKVEAKLILLLANHIGDADVVIRAAEIARKNTDT